MGELGAPIGARQPTVLLDGKIVAEDGLQQPRCPLFDKSPKSKVVLLKRHTPRQSFEPGVVPIRGDPFTPEFNRKCREPSVLGSVSGGSRLLAYRFEYPPMAVAWNDDGCVGLFQQGTTESENIVQ